MSYEFTKLSDVPAVSEFPDGANAIIETNGEIKRCPSSGGGSVPKPLTYDYMPEGYPSKSVQTTTLMEAQAVEFALDSTTYFGSPTNPFEISVGQTYTVNWDGTEYECVCFASTDIVYRFGNMSILGEGGDTGEPFVYGYNITQAAGIFVTIDTSASHTISVKTTEEIITPMAEEYLPENLATKSEVEAAQTTAETAKTTAETAQTTADSNKEMISNMFSSVATFTFDKQTSGRDTFVFNGFNYYKISDFTPAPEDVISFKGTKESGDDFSIISIGNNCMEYGLFIVVATAGNCSITFNDLHGNPATMGFTAPSAGLYAQYRVDNAHQTAGTGEFTLRVSTGSSYITGLLLASSTANSTKQFRITVDDSGTLSATEVTST